MFILKKRPIGLEEITITTSRPIVELDVSANVATLTSESFESLPLASINEAIELQAGIEPGLQIRGAFSPEVSYVVDGISMRTGRFQEPLSSISLTSVEQVQVQTGGFNAEYGNARSGLINVSTKEPPRDRYSFDGLFQFAPAQPKHFGGLPDDPNSVFTRPFLDEEVAFEGTGNWNPYIQRQYQFFEGWNRIAADLQSSGFDVTPQELYDFSSYSRRKDNKIGRPDYVADVTIGGPLLPGSNLQSAPRFLLSYRGTQTMYVLPQARPAYTNESVQLKTAMNLSQTMKLGLTAMTTKERGIHRGTGFPEADIWTGSHINYPWQSGFNGRTPIDPLEFHFPSTAFTNAQFNQVNYDHTMLGLDFTHAFNKNSFYEIRIHGLTTKYRTFLPPLRDDSFEEEDGTYVSQLWAENGVPLSSNAECVGGLSDVTQDGLTTPYCIGGAPLGFSIQPDGRLPFDRASFGSGSRDTSKVSVFSTRFDLTSQINRYLQLKTGAEIIINDFDMHFGTINLALVGPEGGIRVPFSRAMIQGGLYAQGKLEFGGMIANLGIRLDYLDPNTEWWAFNGAFDRALNSNQDELDDILEKEQVSPRYFISPRIGVSFPITERSKLYFNYGHFRQPVDGQWLFGISQSRAGGIDILGNPTLPMRKTVAYEVGFDQNLFNQFLLRISGFYRDINKIDTGILYNGLADFVQYQGIEPWGYADNRGAEITLTKHRGEWLDGFINYTFLQTKSGRFGYAEFYENSFRQQEYLRNSTDFRTQAPIATPYARASLTIKTPSALGNLKGDWRLNLSGEWRDGQKYFWDGLNLSPTQNQITIPNFKQNVSWRDYWMFDMRLSKHLQTRYGDLQFFLDISNVFNLRYLYRSTGFLIDRSGSDQQFYLQSLHLPGDVFSAFDEGAEPYVNIPGNDQPGDYRRPGAEFQPIEAVLSLDATQPNPWAWFWSRETGTYHRWTGEAWENVPEDELQQVLDDKAYIDMPNIDYNTFFNPRRFSLGLRFSF